MADKKPIPTQAKKEPALEIKDLKKGGKGVQAEAQADKIKGGGVKDHSV